MSTTNTQPVYLETEDYIKTELRPNIRYFLLPSSKSFPDTYRLFDLSTKEMTPADPVKWESKRVGVRAIRSFYNSEDNPIPLELNSMKGHLYTKEATTYLSVTEFKDTGKIVLSCCIQEFCYSQATNTLFLRKKDKKFINLYLEKDTLIPTMYVNGMLCYTNYHLDINLKHLKDIKGKGLEFFEETFKQKFLCNLNNSLLTEKEITDCNLLKLYRVKRSSKLLKQLPWTDIIHLSPLYGYSATRDLTSIPVSPNMMSVIFSRHRESVLSSLRKGDTKKAVDKLFFNAKLPKSIKKILIKLPIYTFNYQDMVKLEKDLVKYNINTIRTALELTKGPSYNSIINCIDLGFSAKHTINTFKKDPYLLEDTLRYLNHIMYQPAIGGRTIEEYHDILQAIRQEELDRHRNYGNYTELFKATKTDYIYPPQEIDNCIFRSPTTVNELEAVSSKLNICVRMYQERFFLRVLDIVLITDKTTGDYIGCIELKNKEIVQAKLRFNKFVRANKYVLNETKTWATNNNLRLKTRDLVDDFEYEPTNDIMPDPMRLEMLRAWSESKKKEDKSNIRGAAAPLIIMDDIQVEANNNPW